MDKSFNDEELSDIMKEIEALEEDFTNSEDKTASPVMEELVNLDEEKAIPSARTNIVSLDSKREVEKSSTSMSFKVQGNLTLELQFDIGGKVVALEVNEAGLTIEMDGGMKFSVPMADTASHKKAV
jgi:predicted  nucleic acid-binding Zn-ribbon protein